MKKILFVSGFLIFMLSGCGAIQEGTSDLPETPEYEVSHNTGSGLEDPGNPYKKPELDPNFTNEYEFNSAKAESDAGIAHTQNEADEEQSSISNAKSDVEEQAQSIDSSDSISETEKKAKERLNQVDKSSEISSEADSILKKNTTESSTQAKE